MDLNVFHKTEINQYAKEVKERWGSTKAYREYEQKTKGKTDKEINIAADKLLSLFAEFGTLRKLPPAKKEVQKKVAELQTFITENYYDCTNEILCGLGQMYVCDERMKHNIDKTGGEGTAEFVKQAIEVYCETETV